MVEMIVVASLLLSTAAIAVPGTAQAIDAQSARTAAGFLASRLRLARQQAVTHGRQVAAVFDLQGDEWVFSVCEDGNGNGIRRAEIRAGVDRCIEGPHSVTRKFGGVRIAVDPTLSGPEGSPASADPVRFGASDIASFSPAGSCTPGTVYLRTAGGHQYAVRVGSATGRTRILRYDTGTSSWTSG